MVKVFRNRLPDIPERGVNGSGISRLIINGELFLLKDTMMFCLFISRILSPND